MQKITLGLSVHRPEMISIIADWMRRHNAIFLEEPPAAGFAQMLEGTLAVNDYLSELDVEYPAFSRAMCYLLQELKAEGKKIFQVEPFLEALVGIHEFFAEGHHPEELHRNSIHYPVYLAERNATGALLNYYQTVMTGSFESTIAAVQQFARRDAARFRLRDSLRAQALAPLIKTNPCAFIEAGVIHYPLWRLLRREVSPPHRLQLISLADTALKKLGMDGHFYGPGDQLTLLYIFHPALRQPKHEAVLAARSLVYAKLIAKEELTEDLSTLPHLQDELACIQMVNRLSIDDCVHLFPLVRRAGTVQARQIVAAYLADPKSSHPQIKKPSTRRHHQHQVDGLGESGKTAVERGLGDKVN
jgi:hypothetical protein